MLNLENPLEKYLLQHLPYYKDLHDSDPFKLLMEGTGKALASLQSHLWHEVKSLAYAELSKLYPRRKLPELNTAVFFQEGGQATPYNNAQEHFIPIRDGENSNCLIVPPQSRYQVDISCDEQNKTLTILCKDANVHSFELYYHQSTPFRDHQPYHPDSIVVIEGTLAFDGTQNFNRSGVLHFSDNKCVIRVTNTQFRVEDFKWNFLVAGTGFFKQNFSLGLVENNALVKLVLPENIARIPTTFDFYTQDQGQHVQVKIANEHQNVLCYYLKSEHAILFLGLSNVFKNYLGELKVSTPLAIFVKDKDNSATIKTVEIEGNTFFAGAEIYQRSPLETEFDYLQRIRQDYLRYQREMPHLLFLEDDQKCQYLVEDLKKHFHFGFACQIKFYSQSKHVDVFYAAQFPLQKIEKSYYHYQKISQYLKSVLPTDWSFKVEPFNPYPITIECENADGSDTDQLIQLIKFNEDSCSWSFSHLPPNSLIYDETKSSYLSSLENNFTTPLGTLPVFQFSWIHSQRHEKLAPKPTFNEAFYELLS